MNTRNQNFCLVEDFSIQGPIIKIFISKCLKVYQLQETIYWQVGTNRGGGSCPWRKYSVYYLNRDLNSGPFNDRTDPHDLNARLVRYFRPEIHLAQFSVH